MQPNLRSFAALLALVLTLPLFARDRAVAAGRQGPSALLSIVSGTVSSVTGTTIAIADGAVTVDASAAVIASRRGTGTIAAVTRGSRITAHVAAEATPNAPLRATHIIVIDAEPELTLTGNVQSVDRANRSFVLLGRTIFVTDETTFAGRTGSVTQVIDWVAANSYFAVTANVAGGRIVAESIYGLPSPPTAPELTTFEAVVQTIATAEWAVLREGRTVTVKITPNTTITGSPRPGDRVRVVGTAEPANVVTAVSIHKVDVSIGPNPQPLRWIHGTVLGTHASSWTIQEKDKMIETSVEINANTRIMPGVGNGMQVDVLVEVRDNRLIAVLITRSVIQR